MIYFVALIPATALTIAGYFALYLSEHFWSTVSGIFEITLEVIFGTMNMPAIRDYSTLFCQRIIRAT